MKDAVLKIMEQYNVWNYNCVATLKYLHSQKLQSSYQQLKETEAHLGKKNHHHIFIRFLEAGPLKIEQVLQFITCKFMGLGNNADVSRDGGRGGVLLVNLIFLNGYSMLKGPY